ncbi:MAG: TIGR01777 family protein [Anaerolineae bacterium]|nr:TIGR01777 family protein [Anaerolineae bacterium]
MPGCRLSTGNENSPTGNDFVAEVSRQWEAVSAAVEALGVRRVIVRTGVVLSAAGGALPRMLLPYRLFVGGPFGHGCQWYSWIHIADTAAALCFVIANPQANGAINLTAPTPLTNADFGKALGKVMRRPSLIPLPGFIMHLMFGEVSTVVLDGQRVLPEKLQALGFSFKFPTVETAFQDLLGK